MNNHYTFGEAIKVSAAIIGYDALLTDGATDWDLFNLADHVGEQEAADEERDNDGYYVVGVDGSIGYTVDDGYNVNWLYRVK